jgi:hypothetical protein
MPFDLASYRLQSQGLSQTKFTNPAEVVSRLGAVQSQDFLAAKWALGLRVDGLTETDVDGAFADGSILRTHVLRPTWHFVAPADVRWLLALTGPRVNAQLKYMDRQLELDSPLLKQSNTVLEKALRGGKFLTRAELGSALHERGINTDDLRLTHLVMHAELDGVICSGPRQGKQFTYALLEERVPPAPSYQLDEALVELTKRYFTGHGPATLKDFDWWSGLSASDARRGLEMVKSMFEQRVLDGETYWYIPAQPTKPRTKALLLPCYDEYTVGYTDRKAIYDTSHDSRLDARGSFLAQYTILINGRISGTWKRTLKKNAVVMEAVLFRETRKSEMHAIIEAAERYANFLNLSFSLDFAEAQ